MAAPSTERIVQSREVSPHNSAPENRPLDQAQKLYSNFIYTRIRGFIQNGAPLNPRLRTPRGPRSGCSFEHVFAAFDTDLGIVDLDHADEGLQIGLAERYRSGGKVLTYAAGPESSLAASAIIP